MRAEPFDFPLDRRGLGLIVIDMQRDFIEQGGFGAALGNDVARLQAVAPTVARLIAGFRAAGLLAGGWRDAGFAPFREGVEIRVLVEGAPSVALLRYAPGASVPAHRHPGLETVLVLEGSQCDESGAIWRAR